MPHREWYRMDFKSIESRIPPYECGEPKMIEIFEKPNEPPYWGNMYLLTASVLYPEDYWPLVPVPPTLIDVVTFWTPARPRPLFRFIVQPTAL